MSYWLLYGALVVTPGFLVGAGRTREVARVMSSAAALNLVLALIADAGAGARGAGGGHRGGFRAAFPLLLRLGLRAAGVGMGELARAAWLPAYSLGPVLAGALSRSASSLSPRGCWP